MLYSFEITSCIYAHTMQTAMRIIATLCMQFTHTLCRPLCELLPLYVCNLRTHYTDRHANYCYFMYAIYGHTMQTAMRIIATLCMQFTEPVYYSALIRKQEVYRIFVDNSAGTLCEAPALTTQGLRSLCG